LRVAEISKYIVDLFLRKNTFHLSIYREPRSPSLLSGRNRAIARIR
jgi:hypothetical protein